MLLATANGSCDFLPNDGNCHQDLVFDREFSMEFSYRQMEIESPYDVILRRCRVKLQAKSSTRVDR
jgi:hypothetical protein